MSIKYDYIFCGSGASASLLLLNLHKKNMLSGSKILLIDKEEKVRRDKTFCFWSFADEAISTELKEIISHSWSKIELPNSEIISLHPYQYNHVSSIDLYNKIQELSDLFQIEKMIGTVEDIYHDDKGSYVQLNGIKLYGNKIFDSRNPVYKETSALETHINQSFVGWFIETNHELKDPGVFRFMDFNVDQQGFTQFIYVLPFSNHTVLVEVTRFGAEILEVQNAEKLLQQYIQKNYGKFTLLDVEQGCIPMSNALISNEDEHDDIIYLGARNYKIKASTGYAFKNMFYHAKELAESINKSESTKVLNKSYEDAFKGRFAFYDGLLLNILKTRPKEGKPIFVNLLEKVEIPKILKFLDEKTSITEDISIFYNLPWKPFLEAHVRKLKHQIHYRSVSLLAVSLFLLLLGNGTTLQSIVGYSLFALGMIVIGLPHGAVDHLLETGSWNFSKAPKFIFKYLFISALMAFVWYIFPPLALFTFLLYSAWHFGQADGKQWGMNTPTSFLWGSTLLYYILGTHFNETNNILWTIGELNIPFSYPVWGLAPWLIWAIYKKNLSFIITIMWISITSLLPLIFAFGLYFIGQHSINGWKEIKEHLKMSDVNIWIHALPFHAAAWVFLTLYYLLMFQNDNYESANSWGIFFIFISCISLPHTIALNSLYIKGKIQ